MLFPLFYAFGDNNFLFLQIQFELVWRLIGINPRGWFYGSILVAIILSFKLLYLKKMEEDLILRYRTKEVNHVDCWLYQAVIVYLYPVSLLLDTCLASSRDSSRHSHYIHVLTDFSQQLIFSRFFFVIYLTRKY